MRWFGDWRSRVSTITLTPQSVTIMSRGRYTSLGSSSLQRSKSTTFSVSKSLRNAFTSQSLTLPMTNSISVLGLERRLVLVLNCWRKSRGLNTPKTSMQKIGRLNKSKRRFRKWWRRWLFGVNYTRAFLMRGERSYIWI